MLDKTENEYLDWCLKSAPSRPTPADWERLLSIAAKLRKQNRALCRAFVAYDALEPAARDRETQRRMLNHE